MTWLALIRLVLGVASKALGFAQDRQLMDAGAAKAVRAGLQELIDAIDRKDRRDARLAADPELRRRVRDAVRAELGDGD